MEDVSGETRGRVTSQHMRLTHDPGQRPRQRPRQRHHPPILIGPPAPVTEGAYRQARIRL